MGRVRPGWLWPGAGLSHCGLPAHAASCAPHRQQRHELDKRAFHGFSSSHTHTHTLTLQKPRLTPKGHMTCHMKIGPDNEVTRAATPHSETTAKGTQRGWSASRHGKAKRREAGCRVIARHSSPAIGAGSGGDRCTSATVSAAPSLERL